MVPRGMLHRRKGYGWPCVTSTSFIVFTKFLSLLTIVARSLKINSCMARGTEKVGQHCFNAFGPPTLHFWLGAWLTIYASCMPHACRYCTWSLDSIDFDSYTRTHLLNRAGLSLWGPHAKFKGGPFFPSYFFHPVPILLFLSAIVNYKN